MILKLSIESLSSVVKPGPKNLQMLQRAKKMLYDHVVKEYRDIFNRPEFRELQKVFCFTQVVQKPKKEAGVVLKEGHDEEHGLLFHVTVREASLLLTFVVRFKVLGMDCDTVYNTLCGQVGEQFGDILDGNKEPESKPEHTIQAEQTYTAQQSVKTACDLRTEDGTVFVASILGALAEIYGDLLNAIILKRTLQSILERFCNELSEVLGGIEIPRDVLRNRLLEDDILAPKSTKDEDKNRFILGEVGKNLYQEFVQLDDSSTRSSPKTGQKVKKVRFFRHGPITEQWKEDMIKMLREVADESGIVSKEKFREIFIRTCPNGGDLQEDQTFTTGSMVMKLQAELVIKLLPDDNYQIMPARTITPTAETPAPGVKKKARDPETVPVKTGPVDDAWLDRILERLKMEEKKVIPKERMAEIIRETAPVAEGLKHRVSTGPAMRYLLSRGIIYDDGTRGYGIITNNLVGPGHNNNTNHAPENTHQIDPSPQQQRGGGLNALLRQEGPRPGFLELIPNSGSAKKAPDPGPSPSSDLDLSELEEKIKRVRDGQKHLERLRTRRAEFEKEMDELRKNLAKVEASAKELKEHIADRKHRIHEIDSDIREIEEDIGDFEEKFKKLRALLT